MSWARFDDLYAQHPKLVGLGDFYEVALALDVAGIGWCCLNETDGKVPKAQVGRLIQCRNMTIGRVKVTPELVAGKLVTATRWKDCGDHYEIHDYLKYNPSRAELTARRARVAERVQRHRNTPCNAVTSPLPLAMKQPGNDAPVPEPVPVPVPLNTKQASRTKHCRAERATTTRRSGIYTPEFEAFWNQWFPAKRVGKAEAWAEWQALKPDAALQARILEALDWQTKQPVEDRRFILHACRWLKRRRWEDERPATTPPPHWLDLIAGEV